jgi:hypothetical protein
MVGAVNDEGVADCPEGNRVPAEIFAAVVYAGRLLNCFESMEQFGDPSVGGIDVVESMYSQISSRSRTRRRNR